MTDIQTRISQTGKWQKEEYSKNGSMFVLSLIVPDRRYNHELQKPENTGILSTNYPTTAEVITILAKMHAVNCLNSRLAGVAINADYNKVMIGAYDYFCGRSTEQEHQEICQLTNPETIKTKFLNRYEKLRIKNNGAIPMKQLILGCVAKNELAIKKSNLDKQSTLDVI